MVKREITEEELSLLKEMLKEGASVVEIAKELKAGATWVWQKIRDNKLRTPQNKTSKKKAKKQEVIYPRLNRGENYRIICDKFGQNAIFFASETRLEIVKERALSQGYNIRRIVKINEIGN